MDIHHLSQQLSSLAEADQISPVCRQTSQSESLSRIRQSEFVQITVLTPHHAHPATRPILRFGRIASHGLTWILAARRPRQQRRGELHRKIQGLRVSADRALRWLAGGAVDAKQETANDPKARP